MTAELITDEVKTLFGTPGYRISDVLRMLHSETPAMDVFKVPVVADLFSYFGGGLLVLAGEPKGDDWELLCLEGLAFDSKWVIGYFLASRINTERQETDPLIKMRRNDLYEPGSMTVA